MEFDILKTAQLIKDKRFFPIVPAKKFNKMSYRKWREPENTIRTPAELDAFIEDPESKGVTGFLMITGKVSGIMVYDLDYKPDKGIDGHESFLKVCQWPNTFTVQSGNGGKHLYVMYQDGLKNGVGVLPGIDIRTDGGLIMLPGSVIKSSVTGEPVEYTITNNVDITCEPGIMETMRDLSPGNKKKKKGPKFPDTYDEGNRNAGINKEAFLRVKSMGMWTPEIIMEVVRGISLKKCPEPLDEKDLEKIAQSVQKGLDDGPPVHDWPKKKFGFGEPLKVVENFEYLLNFHGYNLTYDVITREGLVNGEYRSHILIGAEINTMCQDAGLCFSNEEILRNVDVVSYKNSINPFMEFLMESARNWDGVSRIDDLMKTLHSDNPDEMNEILFKTWLANVVHLAGNDGTKNSEAVLILVGDQGVGKTTWARKLMPNPKWFKSGITLNPADKDSVEKATKYVLCELGEVGSSMNHSDKNRMKAFITEPMDEYRASYGRKPEKHPRFTSFIATVNETGFLVDETGDRRFWPIQVDKINFNHNIDMGQLWGEVYYRYLMGEMLHYLPKDQELKLKSRNECFRLETDPDILLNELFDWDAPKEYWTRRTTTEIARFCGPQIKPSYLEKSIRKLITSGRVTDGRTTKARWKLWPPAKIQNEIFSHAPEETFRETKKFDANMKVLK